MKTTPTLGLKLYDGTDAPDLVAGYNASMATLEKTMVAYDGVNRLLVNGTEVAVVKMPGTASTEGLLLDGASRVVRAYTGTKSGGLEPTGLTIRAADYSTSYTLGTGRGELTNIGKINGRAPVGMSNYVILSGSHAAGADYAELVAAGINVVKLGAGGIYLAAATVSLKGVATVNNIPATAGIARATTDNIEVTVNVVAPIPAQRTVVNVPIRFQVSKTAPTIVTVGKNDGDYTLLTCAVTPMSYPS